MNGNIAMKGNLRARVIRAPGPGLAWKLNNWLRWQQIKSLVGVFVVNPIANFFGLMSAYGRLEARLIKQSGDSRGPGQ